MAKAHRSPPAGSRGAPLTPVTWRRPERVLPPRALAALLTGPSGCSRSLGNMSGRRRRVGGRSPNERPPHGVTSPSPARFEPGPNLADLAAMLANIANNLPEAGPKWPMAEVKPTSAGLARTLPNLPKHGHNPSQPISNQVRSTSPNAGRTRPTSGRDRVKSGAQRTSVVDFGPNLVEVDQI